MPPKKRNTISEPERRRKRAKARRASETFEQRAARLERVRIRQAQVRASETYEQRAARLDAKRLWTARFRSYLRRKRSTPAAVRSSVARPSVAPPFEPEVVIKEEPIDIDENPVPSTSRTNQEFILPCTDSFESGSTPAVGEAFTVVKVEPVDEDEPQINSNTKARKRKSAETTDVGQSESPANFPEEDSATTFNNAKDHFDVYGEYIAAKLRKLDWKSCAYVQKAFGDILFDAEMGKFK